jgi:hypothetical protein
MDATQRTGVGSILGGVSTCVIIVLLFTTTTHYAPPAGLVPAAGAISGLCLAGLGTGIYTGRVELLRGSPSLQAIALIVLLAVGGFALGVLLA